MTTNAEIMQKLDDAWNSRDWETFEAFHDPNCVVYWPGHEESPTRGVHDHRAEAERFCKAFPDNRVQPYDILFGDGEFTCLVARFTGTFTSPHEQPDGTTIEPTGRSFDVLYASAARWKDGKIIEEYLLYDNGTFLKHIGLT